MTVVRMRVPGISRRRFGDLFLFAFTSVELALLLSQAATFAIADWIYVSAHLLVLVISITRPASEVQDLSLPSSIAVGVSYAYPYAQVVYLQWTPGKPLEPMVGLVLVTLGACLSFASLLSLGGRFGVWPAFRGLATSGPYRLVRHPMYLAYVLADIGYGFYEYNSGTALLVMAGWASLLYRIHVEERLLARTAGWTSYVALVRYRLLPGLW